MVYLIKSNLNKKYFINSAYLIYNKYLKMINNYSSSSKSSKSLLLFFLL